MRKAKLVIQFDSPVILSFTALSLLALVLDWLTGGWTTTHLFSIYRGSLRDPLFYVRLFGHVLGHSGFSHLIGNLSMLLVIGPACEKQVGARNLVLAMAVTALVSGLFHLILSPGTMLLGASGVVYMLIFLSAAGNASRGEIPLTLILVGVLYIGRELYGLLRLDDVSQLTHIVGAFCGVFCGRMLLRRGN